MNLPRSSRLLAAALAAAALPATAAETNQVADLGTVVVEGSALSHKGDFTSIYLLDCPKKQQVKAKDALGAYAELIDEAKRLSREKTTLQRDLDALQKKIDQKRAQLSDFILIEGGELNGVKYNKAEDYGYEAATRKEGDETYDRPAIEELIRWRLWDRTGGGLMAELGSHQLDAASIFIAALHGGKKQHPLSVSASGSRSLFSPLDRDVDDHVAALYDYPAANYDPNDELGKQRKVTVAYATINGNGFGGYGEVVFGTKGTIQIDSEKEAYLYRTSAVNDKTKVAGTAGNLDVVISEDGTLLDGRLRLWAVFEAGIPVSFLVAVNVVRDN